VVSIANDVLGAVALLLVGVSALAVALLRYLPRVRAHDHGELVSGRVDTISPSPDAHHGAHRRPKESAADAGPQRPSALRRLRHPGGAHVVIAFTTVEGERVLFRASHSPYLRAGDAVTVWYDPADPQAASITTRDQIISRLQLALLAAAFGITVGSLLLWFLLAPRAS
jgi:hypothetical protein